MFVVMYACMYVGLKVLEIIYAVYRGQGDRSKEKMLVFHFGLKAAGLFRMAEAALPMLPDKFGLTLPRQESDEPGDGEEEEG